MPRNQAVGCGSYCFLGLQSIGFLSTPVSTHRHLLTGLLASSSRAGGPHGDGAGLHGKLSRACNCMEDSMCSFFPGEAPGGSYWIQKL